MSPAEIVLGIAWLAVTAYALLGGADFGAGMWDLLAGGAERGAPRRHLIEHVLAPVWEANHVWLIFLLVVLWTAFPPVFAAMASTMYIPLTAAAVGIIGRGSAFAFRKVVEELPLQRLFGATFAGSSLLTPFFLGTVAGGVASGRVPPGNATGDIVTSWVNPTSLLGGVLAVLVCAYLAAVFLCQDANREGHDDLVDWFRRRALATGVPTGVVALLGIGVLRADARLLFEGLIDRALPLIALSGVSGLASIGLVVTRRYVAARVSAALAVAAVIWGWGAGQYPWMLPGHLMIADAAASPVILEWLVVVLLGGTLLVLPPLVWLFVLFQRDAPQPSDPAPQVPSQAPSEGSPRTTAAARQPPTHPPDSR